MSSQPLTAALPGHRETTMFRAASVGFAAALLAFTLAVGFRVGGTATTIAIDDLGLAAFQCTAVVACLVAVSRSAGKAKRPWALLAAASASVALGELVWSFYELGLRIFPPIPSIADAGNLLALPLIVLACLSFPGAPGTTATRGRTLVDGAIIFTSLYFIASLFGVDQIYGGSERSRIGQLVGMFYLIGQTLALPALLVAIQRAQQGARRRLLVLALALVVNTVATTVFAYLVGRHTYGVEYRLVDTGFGFVYLMIALAAIWPAAYSESVSEEGPAKLWSVAIPAICLVAVGLTAFAFKALNQPIDPSPFIVGIGAALAILLLISQLLTHRDSLMLLRSSRRAETELRDRTQLLNEVIAHTPAGLARVRADGRIIDATPRMASLFLVSARRMVGSRLGDYLPADEVATAFTMLQAAHGGKADTYEAESPAKRADSTEIWVQWSGTTVRDSSGTIEYILVMCEDINAKHDAELAAIANLTGLERLNRLKSEFVSIVSHEFRTALTGIQGFSELMRDTELPAREVQQLGGEIFDDAIRLNRLITDMLDLDRIEAGKMAFRVEPVDVNAIATEAVGRARASSAMHTWKLALDSAQPIVAADPDRLTQVMVNLLSNAAKYSPQGGEVLVTSRLHGDFVEVSIRDHGQGIPPDFIDKLFERYERYENTLDGKSKIIGTGLGLVIARRIVEGLGGRIWVDSTVGSGSEFHFTMPTATNSVASLRIAV